MKPIGYLLLVTTFASLTPDRVALQERQATAQRAETPIDLRCNLTYGEPFDITVDLGRRIVQFHGGPNIPIVESHRVAGAVSLRGSSGSYHVESALGPKPHILFWETGSTPQKADCRRQATQAPARQS